MGDVRNGSSLIDRRRVALKFPNTVSGGANRQLMKDPQRNAAGLRRGNCSEQSKL